MVRNLLLEGGALIDMDNLTEYSEVEAQVISCAIFLLFC